MIGASTASNTQHILQVQIPSLKEMSTYHETNSTVVDIAAGIVNCSRTDMCNNSTNGTMSSPPLVPSVMAGIFIGIIILIIVFGNCMVVVAVVKDRHLKQALQNRFILSLAVADMLLGALIMPLSLHLEILKYWALGTLLCDIWLAIDVFLCTASTLSLVVVSLDRYWSVTKALEYPQLRTSRKVNISIGGIWLTSALVSLPPLAGWKSPDEPLQCNLSDELGYIIYSLTISFYIPLVIIAIAYGRIFQVARRRANQHIKLGTIKNTPTSSVSKTDHLDACVTKAAHIKPVDELKINRDRASVDSLSNSNYSLGSSYDQNSKHHNNNDSQSTENSSLKPNDVSIDGDELPPAKRERKFTIFASRFMHSHAKLNPKDNPQLAKLLKEGKKLKKLRNQRGRERRATLTIAIIVMAFVICWLPFSMLYLIDKLCSCGIKENGVFTVIFWLGYCNSAVNPVLYSIFNRDFRLAFQRLLCKRRR